MTGPRDYRILIVEDEAANRMLLQAILESSGFTVASAASGQDGVRRAREFRPDLIILDIVLPDLDGFSVCSILKSENATAEIPVIFVTSLNGSSDVVKGLTIGGVDYIVKPYESAEILARVRLHLKLREAGRLAAESQRLRLEQLRGAQQSYLTDPDTLPEAKCAAAFVPAEEAGGDQYDIIGLSPSVFGYFVADIAGHGIATGFHSSVLKALFRENANLLETPQDTFGRINAIMKGYLDEGQHITAAYLLVNRAAATATLISAGHLPVIMTRPDDGVELLRAEGDVLGAFDHPYFEPITVAAEERTRFWLYTDGTVEDFEAGVSWKRGIDRLAEIVRRANGLPIKAALAQACAELDFYRLGGDDRLLMVCEA